MTPLFFPVEPFSDAGWAALVERYGTGARSFYVVASPPANGWTLAEALYLVGAAPMPERDGVNLSAAPGDMSNGRCRCGCGFVTAGTGYVLLPPPPAGVTDSPMVARFSAAMDPVIGDDTWAALARAGFVARGGVRPAAERRVAAEVIPTYSATARSLRSVTLSQVVTPSRQSSARATPRAPRGTPALRRSPRRG